ncbi:hypothetical protein LF1_30220 [Rubripirellula obstinata]|uniref:Putative restriction endonuclease domain-containing protein n=1 Tax=Rubripirellula obstinata TaxID=406547 RepID=A0A5B1CJM5_9BACT|nr:Uma2 family endonuclease [Rubripirellula obstinata]KAA1260482.1 hypothetical protein LF1_30220 [Rubripirellula obstinata]
MIRKLPPSKDAIELIDHAVVLDQSVLSSLLQERAKSGQDRFDEVWEGTYMMAPAPNNEHQRIGTKLARYLDQLIGDSDRGSVMTTVNVSDRDEGWDKNYRIPDVAVFLANGKAVDCGAYWRGGPDLAIEIVSEGDRSRDKLDFYAEVGTRELLVIDRDPWRLELYSLSNGGMQSLGLTEVDGAEAISTSIDVGFSLKKDPLNDRPAIQISDKQSTSVWTF